MDFMLVNPCSSNQMSIFGIKSSISAALMNTANEMIKSDRFWHRKHNIVHRCCDRENTCWFAQSLFLTVMHGNQTRL